MPLSSFSPRTRAWFEQAFAEPTPAQAQAWPAIARGEHVLLSAPTGSGKTLAAFLWALDRLSTEGEVEENGMPRARGRGIGNKGGTNPARGDLGAPENGMGSRTPTGTPKNPNPNNTPRSGEGVRVVYVSP